MAAIGAQEKIEVYLNRLRGCLRGVGDEEMRDIVEELRSHILDKATANGELAAGGVDRALAALGRPEELASEYITDVALARAEVSRSPFRILASLFRWASLSVAGFFVLTGAVFGYFLGVVLVLCAVMKTFHPQNAGLWTYRDAAGDLVMSLRMGFGSVPEGGRDMLGWWIVPIGWSVGCALVMLTTHFAIWCARLYRKSRAARRG